MSKNIPSSAQVPVPVQVLEEFVELLKRSPHLNRQDVRAMIEAAAHDGFQKAASWIQLNEDSYRLGLVMGFKPANGDADPFATNRYPLVPEKEGDES